LFVVKKLGKNGTWNTISLIDENGSFRGEAKFESKNDALEYLKEYKRKMKNPQELKVFCDKSNTDKKSKNLVS
jgi:hypothetical protein